MVDFAACGVSLPRYPFQVPSNTVYSELGLGPEASTREIAEAKAQLVSELTSRLKQSERGLAEVMSAVPGLREARNRVATLTTDGTDGLTTDPEVLEAMATFGRLERHAREQFPDYDEWSSEATFCARRIEELNRLPLLTPEQRRTYDEEHPPLGLLDVLTPTYDDFARDKATALALIRTNLEHFFADHGEEVLHPNELTRADFSQDFSPSPLLDQEVP